MTKRLLTAAVLALCALAAAVPLRAQDSTDRPGPPDSAGLRYYVSNALGMPNQEIGWYRREEFPYVLVVQSNGQRQVRSLLFEGREIRRWEEQPGELRELENGIIRERRLFDSAGRLSEEQLYQEGRLETRILYHYGSRGLFCTQTFDAAGELLYRDLYALGTRGELRRVRREQPSGTASQELSLSGARGSLVEERLMAGGRRQISRYDARGRATVRELWQDGRLIERERFEYSDESGVLSRSELSQPESGRLTVGIYDESGRLIQSTVTQGEQGVETIRHTRDGEGRVVETTRRSSLGLEQWKYSYDAQGRLLSEEYRLRGLLGRAVRYLHEEAGQRRIEELYREGRLFLRVHYRGSEKIKEEFIRDGEVLRVRE